MKSKKMFSIAFFSMLSISSVWAFDVHFYSTSSSEPLKSLSNVSKIEFNQDDFAITMPGTSDNVNLASVDYFKFSLLSH